MIDGEFDDELDELLDEYSGVADTSGDRAGTRISGDEMIGDSGTVSCTDNDLT